MREASTTSLDGTIQSGLTLSQLVSSLFRFVFFVRFVVLLLAVPLISVHP